MSASFLGLTFSTQAGVVNAIKYFDTEPVPNAVVAVRAKRVQARLTKDHVNTGEIATYDPAGWILTWRVVRRRLPVGTSRRVLAVREARAIE